MRRVQRGVEGLVEHSEHSKDGRDIITERKKST